MGMGITGGVVSLVPPLGQVPFGITPFGFTPFGTTPFGFTPFGVTPVGFTPVGTLLCAAVLSGCGWRWLMRGEVR